MFSLKVIFVIVCLMYPRLSPMDESIVRPETPIVESRAPSEKVVNGILYESGALEVVGNTKLVFPSDFKIETYDGKRIRFFVTKSLRCSGHPPAPMRISEVRSYFGIAQKFTGSKIQVCTYGEWANKGGSAAVKVLVLVPKSVEYEQNDRLNGPHGPAYRAMDFNAPELKTSYWYSGTKPRENWTAISTELNFNRFLQP